MAWLYVCFKVFQAALIFKANDRRYLCIQQKHRGNEMGKKVEEEMVYIPLLIRFLVMLVGLR